MNAKKCELLKYLGIIFGVVFMSFWPIFWAIQVPSWPFWLFWGVFQPFCSCLLREVEYKTQQCAKTYRNRFKIQQNYAKLGKIMPFGPEETVGSLKTRYNGRSNMWICAANVHAWKWPDWVLVFLCTFMNIDMVIFPLLASCLTFLPSSGGFQTFSFRHFCLFYSLGTVVGCLGIGQSICCLLLVFIRHISGKRFELGRWRSSKDSLHGLEDAYKKWTVARTFTDGQLLLDSRLSKIAQKVPKKQDRPRWPSLERSKACRNKAANNSRMLPVIR